jgi:hypothetical protein
MNRNELLTAAAYRLNKNPPPNMDTATEARLIGFLNQRQRRLLTLPGLRHLREATVTVASVVDQAAYVLANIAKILRIWDPTNQRVLFEMSQQDLRLIDPVPISGTPEAFIWTGRQAVAMQPSDASSVFVVSSSAADISQTVTVTGVITGGYPRTATVMLTGTTPVDVSATTSTWTRLDKFYLSAAAVGVVTLTEDSGGGTELAQITDGQTQTLYTGFTLYPTPTAAITYQVDITRATTDLLSATDEPLLPLDFHDLILLWVVADEYQHVNDERYAIARSEAERREGEMLYFLSETAIGRPFSLTRSFQRPSQLGSWFPAGS